jgi:hypothetical protein
LNRGVLGGKERRRQVWCAALVDMHPRSMHREDCLSTCCNVQSRTLRLVTSKRGPKVKIHAHGAHAAYYSSALRDGSEMRQRAVRARRVVRLCSEVGRSSRVTRSKSGVGKSTKVKNGAVTLAMLARRGRTPTSHNARVTSHSTCQPRESHTWVGERGGWMP